MAVFIPVISLLTFSAAAAVLWYGGRQVIDGVVSPGELFAFVLFAGILIGPFSSAARVFAQIREAQGATARIFEILDTQAEIRDAPNAVALAPVSGRLAFEQVSFAYDARQPVLTGVSFDAEPGELVAIVGPTGAGKTTVMSTMACAACSATSGRRSCSPKTKRTPDSSTATTMGRVMRRTPSTTMW